MRGRIVINGRVLFDAARGREPAARSGAVSATCSRATRCSPPHGGGQRRLWAARSPAPSAGGGRPRCSGGSSSAGSSTAAAGAFRRPAAARRARTGARRRSGAAAARRAPLGPRRAAPPRAARRAGADPARVGHRPGARDPRFHRGLSARRPGHRLRARPGDPGRRRSAELLWQPASEAVARVMGMRNCVRGHRRQVRPRPDPDRLARPHARGGELADAAVPAAARQPDRLLRPPRIRAADPEGPDAPDAGHHMNLMRGHRRGR